jgi:hypothetical protein
VKGEAICLDEGTAVLITLAIITAPTWSFTALATTPIQLAGISCSSFIIMKLFSIYFDSK